MLTNYSIGSRFDNVFPHCMKVDKYVEYLFAANTHSVFCQFDYYKKLQKVSLTLTVF